MSILNPPKLKIRTLEDLRDAHAIWTDLSKEFAKTVYQTPDFLNSWLETVGHVEGFKPLFIHMTDEAGGQLFLPLCVKKTGVLKIAQFLGGKHSNFNLPIFNDATLKWDATQIKAALVEAGKLAKIDVFSFKNQPVQWQNFENPLSKLMSQPSPSFGYSLSLMSDSDLLISQRLSKEGRKKLRQKENGIAKLGNVQFLEGINAEHHDAMLQAYFEQKSVQFKGKGIIDPFDGDIVRQWLGSLDGLRLFGLELDGKYLAIWGVVEQGRHVSGIFTSYDTQNDAARSSPGEVLLVWLIRKLCADGYSSIDFGVGEARYKNTWCDNTIELVDTYVGVSFVGLMSAFFMSLKGHVKRKVKQSSFAFGVIKRIKSKLKFH